MHSGDAQNFAKYGPAFAQVLCAMPYVTDDGHAAFPTKWRQLTALLRTMIEDNGHASPGATLVAFVPMLVVVQSRASAGM